MNGSDAQTIDFAAALERIRDGERVTRLDWKDEGQYGLLHNGQLCLRLPTGLHTWIVSDGDMNAGDWIVLRAN